jgi:hypothetical protein
LMRAVPLRRTAEQLDNEVAARMYRQHRFTSIENPLELVTVVDESALHRPVGGSGVLREQLEHMATLAELDTVTMHVLPTAVGAHAAVASGFSILNFGELGEPDMAYVEHTLGALSLDKDGDVARAKLTFERVLSDALDPAESLALIRRLARSWRQRREWRRGGVPARRGGRARHQGPRSTPAPLPRRQLVRVPGRRTGARVQPALIHPTIAAPCSPADRIPSPHSDRSCCASTAIGVRPTAATAELAPHTNRGARTPTAASVAL